MPIDAFCHAIPLKYLAALKTMADAGKIQPFSDFFIGETRVPGISNMDERFALMDKTPETVQIISLTGPFLETIAGPEDGAQLARIANDEIARLVENHPDRFAAGIAALPFNNLDVALSEVDRAIEHLGLRGIQIGTDVNGKPLDSPEFRLNGKSVAIDELDLPVSEKENILENNARQLLKLPM